MNSVLYYPKIEIVSEDWVKSALLVWDKIYRIQPNSYSTPHQDFYNSVNEHSELIGVIPPGDYASKIANDFISRIESGNWRAAALTFDSSEYQAYERMHPEKLDVTLRHALEKEGLAQMVDDWYSIPTEFTTNYMTYLAKKIAEHNKLDLATDFVGGWIGQNYFISQGKLESDLNDGVNDGALAQIVMRDFIPQNISEISITQIVRFREKYADERNHFFGAMRNLTESLKGVKEKGILNDIIEKHKKEITEANLDYSKSLDLLKYNKLTGLKVWAFPVSIEILKNHFGNWFSSTVAIYGAAILGVIATIRDYRSSKKDLKKNHKYSYLLDLQELNNIKGITGPFQKMTHEFLED